MENKSHALVAGFFTIALAIAAVISAIWLNGDNQARIPYLLTTTDSVSGLNPQAAVKYRGMEVGKVEDIRFDDKKPGQILVRIGVHANTPMTSATFAQLGMQGLTGLAFVQLNADEKIADPKLLATSHTTPARIAIRPSLLDRIADGGEDLLAKADAAMLRVNTLLSDENQKSFAGTLKSFDRAAARIDKLAEDLGPNLSAAAQSIPGVTNAAGKTLKTADGALRSVDVLAADARKLANNLNTRLDAIERITKSVEAVSKDVAQSTRDLVDVAKNTSQDARVDALSADFSRTSRTIETAVDKFAEEPSAVVFGPAPARPGPGESGFVAPASASTAVPR